MAIPTANTNAPAMVIPVFPRTAPAKVTPTDMPSGILCSVTARTSIVVFFKLASMPSGRLLSRCRWGIRLSRVSKNAIPPRSPTAAGTHAVLPCSEAISMAGLRSDHTEAAIITPDANPRSIFSILCPITFRMQNTIAEPSVVPAKGINSPSINCISFP